MNKMLKWYCNKCIQYKAIFKVNKWNKKICHECNSQLIVKEVDI